jgi:hypothetical protein
MSHDLSTEIYKPSVVRKGKWEGHVKVKLLTFDERYAAMEEARALGEGGHLGYMRKLVGQWKDKFVEVSLKRLRDGREFKSYDDLTYGPDRHEVLVEVASVLLNGVPEDESGN